MDNLILGWSEGFHDAAATIVNGDTGSIVFCFTLRKIFRK